MAERRVHRPLHDALEFDSEELEELTLGWEDVRVLRTARVVQVRFKDQTQVTGRVVIDASTVRVLGDTEQQFSSGVVPEKDDYRLIVGVGFDL